MKLIGHFLGCFTASMSDDCKGIEEWLLPPKAEEKEGDLKGRIWEESKKIWRVATPSVIARVSSFGTIVVTQSFVGHISAVDLASYALVQTLSVRFVNGILVLLLLHFQLSKIMK